jgi:hypothetical protein
MRLPSWLRRRPAVEVIALYEQPLGVADRHPTRTRNADRPPNAPGWHRPVSTRRARMRPDCERR